MTPSTSPSARENGAPPASRPFYKSRLFLLAAIAVLAAAWGGRLFLANRPSGQPPSSDPEARLKFYNARLKANPNDAEAALQAALAEEERGYYMSAIDKIEAARAHGAPQSSTAGVMGRCLGRINRFDEAAKELDAAVKLSSEDPSAMADLAALQVDSGDPDGGAATVRAYISAHPALLDRPQVKDRDVLARLNQLLERVSEHELAYKTAAAVVQVDPVYVAGLAAAGRSLFLLKKYAESEAMFIRALAISPNDAGLQYWRGRALIPLGGKEAEALKLWEKAVALDPKLTPAYFEAGKTLAARGDHDTAANLLMLAAAGGDNPGNLYSRAADSWAKIGKKPQEEYCRAMAAQDAADYPAALRFFQALSISSSPTWKKRGLDGEAETYRRMGRNREFLYAAKKAAFTGLADDYLRIADAYLLLHNETERVAVLRKALELDPKLAARIHRELGAYADRRQLQDEAEKEYQLAIEADPNNSQFYSDLARVLIRRRTQGDRMQRAIQAAENAVEVSPNNGDAVYKLGQAYRVAERNADAVAAFQHAIDLRLRNASVYLDLGQTYARLKDKRRADEALATYRKQYQTEIEGKGLVSRAKAFPKDSAAQAALAEFALRTRDFTQAGRSFRAALAIDKSNGTMRAGLIRVYKVLGILDDAMENDPILRSAGSNS